MAALKTDFKNAVLDTTENTERVFDIVDENGNVVSANVHLVEKTIYSENGDKFGAIEINNTNSHLVADDGAGNTLDFQFATDGTDFGYIDGNGNFQAFKTRHTETANPNSRALLDMGIFHKKRYVDLSAVPNINTATRTISAVYTSGNGLDLGAANSVRYIKTSGLMVTPTGTKSITANGNNQDVLNYAKVNVAVNQTPSYRGYSPVGTNNYYISNGDSYNDGGCRLTVGQPSVSKNGSVITVTIPETVRYGGYWLVHGEPTSPNQVGEVSRSITVTLNI